MRQQRVGNRGVIAEQVGLDEAERRPERLAQVRQLHVAAADDERRMVGILRNVDDGRGASSRVRGARRGACVGGHRACTFKGIPPLGDALNRLRCGNDSSMTPYTLLLHCASTTSGSPLANRRQQAACPEFTREISRPHATATQGLPVARGKSAHAQKRTAVY
jgi:hypothetical protein